MEDRKKISEAVKEARKAKSMTQEELAEAAGVGRATISRLENGNRNTSSDRIFKIARVLEIDLNKIK